MKSNSLKHVIAQKSEKKNKKNKKTNPSINDRGKMEDQDEMFAIGLPSEESSETYEDISNFCQPVTVNKKDGAVYFFCGKAFAPCAHSGGKGRRSQYGYEDQ